MQELGPSERCKDPRKMLVYCPDKNHLEKRFKEAFYKVPNSDITVIPVDEHKNLVVIRGDLQEEAYHCKEEGGFIWWGKEGSDFIWKIGGQGNAHALEM